MQRISGPAFGYFLGGELGGFELGWSAVFQRRVLAERVVVALDVGEEFGPGIGRGFEATIA
jgi:hypothetical protein